MIAYQCTLILLNLNILKLPCIIDILSHVVQVVIVDQSSVVHLLQLKLSNRCITKNLLFGGVHFLLLVCSSHSVEIFVRHLVV